MSTSKPCTAEEIAEKRRIALERNRKHKEEYKKMKMQISNNENRLKLNAEAKADIQALSAQQKAEIERKRLEAIERAKANKLITSDVAKDLAAKKLSSGKVQAPSKIAVISNRPVPYLKPQNLAQSSASALDLLKLQETPISTPGKAPAPSKAVITNARPKPYQKPQTPVMCSLEIISDNRFVAKTDAYNETVINEFKKVKSKSYSKFNQRFV